MKYVLLLYTILQTNKMIHNRMLKRLLKAVVEFFDYTPSGEIINKFSNDIGFMDIHLH